MPQLFEEKHLATIDKLLKLEVSGSWYLRREMEEYMSQTEVSDMFLHLDQIYEKGVIKNNGRPFNPKYKFHRTLGMDTQSPQVMVLVLLPGNSMHREETAGELLLNVELGAHGAIRLSVPPESMAQKLARENNWKATAAELEALNTLIEAARALKALGSKNFPIDLQVSKSGVKINTGYYNPADAVRAALAKA
jgi:hypothetical protein